MPDEQTSPSARRAAQRALILAALTCRGSLEQGPEDPQALDVHQQLCDWIQEIDLAGELAEPERKVIEAELGTLSPQTAIECGWRAEGLAVLAWALQFEDFPPHDEKVDPFEVAGSVGLLSEDAADFLAEAELCSSEALAACRETLYAVHCRLREFLRTSEPSDIRDSFEPKWFEQLDIEPVFGPQGDLRLGPGELSDADSEAVSQAEWLTCERHRAVIWLVEDQDLPYAQVPVDT